jgi:actin-like ATPase involved in cell morphogenesis
MLGLGNRALQIPSVLYLQEDGQFLVGEAAERRGATDPSRLVREFKRRIGDPIPLMVAGTPFSAQALSARLLSSVVATATERRGGPPDEIVLTYPANWGAYKRELVDQVISLAGIGPTVTCPEPQAAAIQYAAQAHLRTGDRVAVYDLGGGTFDVCVLEKTGNGFTILGNPEGIEQLGGVDFDEAVFQHVVGALGPSLEDLDLDSPEGRTALTRLRRDCVEAKEALSVDVDTMIPVTLPGRSTSVRLTRAELETLIAPALEQTVEATGRALRASGTTSDRLTAIVLVGGSSRIPLVSHLLQSRFSTPTALDTHPKHDIALGAVQFIDAPATATTAPLAAVGATAPVTSPAPGKLPKPARKPLSPQIRRRIAFAAGGVAVLAIGVLVAIQLLSGSHRPTAESGSSASSGGTTSHASGGPRSASPPVPALKALPVAATPLSASELVIPVLQGGSQNLFVADATDPSVSRNLSQVAGAAPGDSDGGAALSPDRKTMIFSRSTGSAKPTLWVAGVDGSGAHPLFATTPQQCADGISSPAWNRKITTQLVVSCKAGKSAGLYLLDTNGKVLRTLFTTSGEGAGVSDAALSPDGTKVVFQAQRIPGTGIFTVPVDGSRKVSQLTSGADADSTWAPDGTQVAFRRVLAPQSWAIFLVDTTGKSPLCARALQTNTAGGGKLCQVTDGSTLDQDPAWAPDGRQLAYRHGPLDAARIYVVKPYEVSTPRPVWSSNPGNQKAATWLTR